MGPLVRAVAFDGRASVGRLPGHVRRRRRGGAAVPGRHRRPVRQHQVVGVKVDNLKRVRGPGEGHGEHGLQLRGEADARTHLYCPLIREPCSQW
jgi:hypothetical protein